MLKTYSSLAFGLIVIAVGLARSVEASAFKPNSFYFCLTMGLLAISSAYLHQLRQSKMAHSISAFTGITILAFYLNAFISVPEKDATLRVAIAIVSSIAYLAFIFLPKSKIN